MLKVEGYTSLFVVHDNDERLSWLMVKYSSCRIELSMISPHQLILLELNDGEHYLNIYIFNILRPVHYFIQQHCV